MVAVDADATFPVTMWPGQLPTSPSWPQSLIPKVPPPKFQALFLPLYRNLLLKMVKQDWIGFETQNLNDLRENKPKGPPNTTLTGWAQQKFNTKWYRNQDKINKTKTERGKETYNERCHHWYSLIPQYC